MKIVQQRLYQRIHDVTRTPEMLNKIEREKREEGYEVQRGLLGSVILQLDDGEVHYTPSGNVIYEFTFSYDEPVFWVSEVCDADFRRRSSHFRNKTLQGAMDAWSGRVAI